MSAKQESRRGISFFLSLANRIEVEQGLLMLKTDIQNGKILKVMKSYENNCGDYYFISTQKFNG
jgi:hypothetical protein